MLLGSLGLGAGLSYLLDPDSGRRRRALARDKMVSATHAASDAFDTTSRDVRNRTRGLIAGIRSRAAREDVSDPVLVERVRAKIGEVVGHPRSIEATVEQGRVTLRGAILADEVDRLIRRVASVRGVRSVDNQLDVHGEAGQTPELQGEPAPPRAGGRFEFMQMRWSPTARLLAGITGGALSLCGLRQAGLTGIALGAAGVTLLTRALTNLELGRLVRLGAPRQAVPVEKPEVRRQLG
ncbi:MAG: BON domain-containing protein [Candidatus Rokuibacteriota bacterium]